MAKQSLRHGGGDYELPKPLEETVLVKKTHHLSEPLHTIDSQKTSGKLRKYSNVFLPTLKNIFF